MKKIVVLILLALTSCVKDNCVDYLIENQTEKDLNLVLFEEGTERRNTEIKSNSTLVEFMICDVGHRYLSYEIFDSIQVRINDLVLKTYYPDSPGKNIYNVDDRDTWILEVNRKHYQKFVFEITEEDLK
ncbi:hypothetical protein ACFOUP_10065 [Belliella kenyensis]|uniref:Lipoprotein n=1 Tax=Belliella kenyensis TaxID=1472724 RepID=A0ABV8EM30_9BACT|nr:hypothetical protein [Belliella kenyensis]MCH7403291.1 hypothetical protein [Belliella kenyensis]MDN3602932.1 hypothetical protein [Belliella kenyensis]